MIEPVQDLLLSMMFLLFLVLFSGLALSALWMVIYSLTPKRRTVTQDAIPLPAQSKRGKPKRYTDYVYDEDGPENYED